MCEGLFGGRGEKRGGQMRTDSWLVLAVGPGLEKNYNKTVAPQRPLEAQDGWKKRKKGKRAEL